MNEKQFQRYFQRLSVEGMLKAALLALASGACAAVVSGIVTWFTITENIGLSLAINLIVFFVVSALLAPAWYFLFFRPTVKKSAHRIDRLGLEERMITAVELQNEDTYLARLQREDAQNALEKTSPKQLKLRIPQKILLFLAIAFFCGAAATTVAALGAAGFIYSGYETMDAIIPEEPPVYVSVTYEAIDGGIVDGEFAQVIEAGQSTTEVLAIADDGYQFVMWSDGYKEPARYERDVTTDLVYYALFQYIGETSQSPDGDPEDDDEQEPQPQPSESESENDPEEDAPPQDTPQNYSQNNMIINGNTQYKPQLPQYREEADTDMSDSSEEDKKADEIIKLYYTLIG